MARPLKTSRPLCIRIDIELEPLLDRQAETKGITPQQLVRHIVEATLRRNLTKPTP